MIKERTKNGKVYTAYYSMLFLCVVAIGYSVLLRNNRSMVWYIDALNQYYPTLLYIGKMLRSGIKGVLAGNLQVHFYDLSLAMGESIIGTLNYYGLGDPITLLAVFANQSNGIYIYAFSYFLRVWLAGLAFQRYCTEMGMDRRVSIVASLMYCFSGFTMKGGGRYIEWLSVLVYFPLMLIGTERTIRNKRVSLTLLFTTAYGSLCGFYFLYMSSLAMGIYWIIRLLSVYGFKDLLSCIRTGCRFAIAYILGLLVTAPIFLTAVTAYLSSKRSSSGILDILLDPSNWIPALNEEFYKLSPVFQHGYFGYILIVEYMALFLLFFFRGRRSRQLQIASVMAFVAVLLPITGWVFNGFGETNVRWVFLVHFLMALVFVHVLSSMQGGGNLGVGYDGADPMAAPIHPDCRIGDCRSQCRVQHCDAVFGAWHRLEGGDDSARRVA